ncbi:unnamed protein product [Haemonchus placei]|uniref:Transmembrane protein n=1 Tax=Haemonchus placei TaxID=6290 RepID=A0A0N4WP08_HAEPC|nr:unnamed protein product [Haemonchus placei]
MVSDNTTYYGNERSAEYDEPPMSDHFATFPDTDITPTLEGFSIVKEGFSFIVWFFCCIV